MLFEEQKYSLYLNLLKFGMYTHMHKIFYKYFVCKVFIYTIYKVFYALGDTIMVWLWSDFESLGSNSSKFPY